MNSKKGIELQFHWIFVMIAGALILAFFFSVAEKQRTISTERLQLTLANDVENIFTGAIVSRGTAQRLPAPPQGISFSCTGGCDCKFGIGAAQRPFGDKSLFAPALLSDQDIVVWALEFKMPYRVTNLLYLTNPNIKYYLVRPSKGPLEQLFLQVTKTIPPLIEYENVSLTEVTSLKQGSYQETKFVFFDNGVQFAPPDLDGSYNRAAFSAIRVGDNSVSFFDKDGTRFNRVGSPAPYVGIASIYAAIFSEDRAMYECGLQTVFRKLAYISEIYAERAGELSLAAIQAEKLSCNYGDLKTPSLAAPKTIIDLLLKQKESADKVKTKLNDADIQRLVGLKTQLEDSNRLLVQQSCPEVF